MLTVNEDTAVKIRPWFSDRGGVAVWKSINLSAPGGELLTPAVTDGKPTPKPHRGMGWVSNTPLIISDPAGVTVIIDKEVKRFHIAVRLGAQGFTLKLTDASSARVRRELDKWEGASYVFDYETQEAVIMAPMEKMSWAEYINRGIAA
jgi:hypothetical protein